MFVKIKKRLLRAMSDEYWRIALRKKTGDSPSLYERLGTDPDNRMGTDPDNRPGTDPDNCPGTDTVKGFNIMPGEKHITYADPFLFDHDNKTWLFYERQDLTDMKGTLWCRCIDPSDDMVWGPPFKILEEDFHLSYPQVFEQGGQVYMIPESRGAGQVRLYRASDFPIKWEFAGVLINRPLVDTTLYAEGSTLYLYGYGDDKLVVYKITNGIEYLKLSESNASQAVFPENALEIIYESGYSKTLRPGGRLIKTKEGFIRPAQDCREFYGKGLFFVKAEHEALGDRPLNVNGDRPLVMGDRPVSVNGDRPLNVNGDRPVNLCLSPEMFYFSRQDVNAVGIHTYNESAHYEAVDILHREVSFGVLFKKLEWKLRSIKA